jgi:hypothetical protein
MKKKRWKPSINSRKRKRQAEQTEQITKKIKWGESENKCAICVRPLSEKCEGCNMIPNDWPLTSKCIVSFGKCGHNYHKHCVDMLYNKQAYFCIICTDHYSPRFEGRFEGGLIPLTSTQLTQSVSESQRIIERKKMIIQKQICVEKQLKMLTDLLEPTCATIFETCLDEKFVCLLIDEAKNKDFVFFKEHANDIVQDVLGRNMPNCVTSLKQINTMLNTTFHLEFYGEHKFNQKEIQEECCKIIDEAIKTEYSESNRKYRNRIKRLTETSLHGINYVKIRNKLLDLLKKPTKQYAGDLTWLDLSESKWNRIKFPERVDFSNSNLMNVKTVGDGSTANCIHGKWVNSNCENMVFGFIKEGH